MGGNELEITFRLQNTRERMKQNNPRISGPYRKHLIRFVLRLMKDGNITAQVEKIKYLSDNIGYSVKNKRSM